jgi:hypothetical protein
MIQVGDIKLIFDDENRQIIVSYLKKVSPSSNIIVGWEQIGEFNDAESLSNCIVPGHPQKLGEIIDRDENLWLTVSYFWIDVEEEPKQIKSR